MRFPLPRYIPTLLFILALPPACAPRSQDLVVPGKTTVMELKSAQGDPQSTAVPESRPQAKLLCYHEGCCYQVERSFVMTTACEPTEEESSLQYWRHKWKGDPQRYETVPIANRAHGGETYQLISDRARTAVIYEPQSDRVVRVVRYGTR